MKLMHMMKYQVYTLENNGKIVDYYSDVNYFSIRGIVTDKMRVIDGYHRILSANNDRVLVLKTSQGKH